MGDKLAKCPSSDRDQINLMNRKIREEQDLLRKTKNSLNSGQNSENEKVDRIQVEEDLFANADIIAVTLNSSMNGQMEKFFVKKLRTRGKNLSLLIYENLNYYFQRIWGKNFQIFFYSNIAGGRNARPFSICIMDEASQCVEPEALVPLKLGMYFNNLRDFWSKKIDTKNKTYFYIIF